MNAPSSFSPSVRQLRAFRAVYLLRKLSAAAEQLAITQTAVSGLIRQLEAGLGTRLFDRTTRSLRPTTAATEALAKRERILRHRHSLGTALSPLGPLPHVGLSLPIT